jgi:HEAT repeat protein
MKRFLIVLAMLLIPLPVAAEEDDDTLARQLGKVVRDPRQTVEVRIEAARMLSKLGLRAGAAVPDLMNVLNTLRGQELESLQESVVETLGQLGYSSRAALPSMAKTAGRSIDLDLALKRSTDLIITSADSQNVNALVSQLRSRDSSQRIRAVKALGNLGPAARFAVPNLLDVLNDPDGDVRRAAIAAIRQIVPDAKPTEAIIRALAADLTDPDPNVRLIALRALGRSGQAAAAASSAIDALRNDPDPDVRRAAADALSRILGGP